MVPMWMRGCVVSKDLFEDLTRAEDSSAVSSKLDRERQLVLFLDELRAGHTRRLSHSRPLRLHQVTEIAGWPLLTRRPPSLRI